MRKVRLLTLATLALILAAAYAQAQTYTVLYNFGSKSGDPTAPRGIIAQGRGGNLWSTANDEWTNNNVGDPGTIFEFTPAGVLTVPHRFNGADGQSPVGGVTLFTDGSFYGTSEFGGTFGKGTMFKITPGGELTTLHNFSGGAGGADPMAPPTQGKNGNFYGTTFGGGGFYGSVYKITPSGAFTKLHSFDSVHGANPAYALVQGTDDNFYGTTVNGGTHNLGTIFRISSSGKFAVLFNFDGTHGKWPVVLIQGRDGNFYGTGSRGGPAGDSGGVVFKMTTAGRLTVLHNFGGADGWNVSGLMQATDGNLYGTTTDGGTSWGVLFRITPTAAFTVLHNFEWSTGSSPQHRLLQHTNGVLYGNTKVGGIGNNGDGTFYSFNIGLGPFVRLLPEFGRVGRGIDILGQGFTGTTNVSFNGAGAGFTVVNDTYLTATVPDGATTGFVSVTTPSGTLTSEKKFRVRPQITSFSPTSGPVGTPVVVTGVSLKETTKVTFGGIKATSVTVNSDMQVTATAPAGALTGKIVVTTFGGAISSPTAFTVTP
jgi:uncharacterized repeat protein (TIGR03803 family)